MTEEYDGFKIAKDEFKEALTELGESKKTIIFIDELDRCRPTFAIETLEVVKHFFDVEHLVFIFALDMEQLSHSIATIYGLNMNSSGYLRRFFDMQLRIPTPQMREFVDAFVKESVTLNPMVVDITLPQFSKTVCSIFEKLKLSLRDIKIIFANYLVFCNYHNLFTQDNAETKLCVYLFLLCIKYKDIRAYDTVMHKSYGGGSETEVLKKIRGIHTKTNAFLETFKQGWMQREITSLPKDSRKSKQFFEELRLSSPRDHEKVFQYLERHLEIISFPDSVN